MDLAGAATDISVRPFSPTAPARARAYRSDIDGLRAIAILSVVFHHAGTPLLTGGFTGVDIFFVISGYLIGGQIFAELRARTFTFASFYRRRAKRILPAFFAVLLFTLIVAMLLLSPAEAATLARSAFAATLSVSNILFWGTSNYFASKSSFDPMLMTWSLGVEEQFYAFAPLLLVPLARVRRRATVPAILFVCASSFAFAWIVLAAHPMMAFYLLPARAWELGIGAALAIVESTRNASLIHARFTQSAGLAALALILAPIFLLNSASPFPGPAAVPTVLGTTLAIAAPASFINRRVLSLKPLAFIGKISYSLYLWHWPLLGFLRILYGDAPPATVSLAAIATSFVLAALAYYFIEQPFRQSRRPSQLLLIRYATVSAIAATLCAVIWLSRGIPQRFPTLAATDQAARALASDKCLAGYGTDTPNLSTACVQNSASPRVLALWGDSHSAALAPGLRAAANAQQYDFIQAGKASCAPIHGATHFSPRIPMLAHECLRFNEEVLRLVRDDSRIRIVVLNADWAGYLYNDWQDGWLSTTDSYRQTAPTPAASNALFVESLSSTIRELQSAGKQVIVINDVPGFAFDPLWKVRTQAIPTRRILAAWLQIPNTEDTGSAPPSADPHIALAGSLLQNAIENAPRAQLPAAQLPATRLIDLKPALCPSAGQCAYRNGQTVFYLDSNHLSAAGAFFAARQLRLPEIPATPQIVAARVTTSAAR